jgi:hypothetical protein
VAGERKLCLSRLLRLHVKHDEHGKNARDDDSSAGRRIPAAAEHHVAKAGDVMLRLAGIAMDNLNRKSIRDITDV